MTVAESIKKIRKQYKMTQQDISGFLGISRSGYTYYETGKTVPSIEMLKKLATIYNTTIDNVVGMPTDRDCSGKTAASNLLMAEGNVDPLMFMKKEEQALIMAYRLLSEEKKKEVSEMTLLMLGENNKEN